MQDPPGRLLFEPGILLLRGEEYVKLTSLRPCITEAVAVVCVAVASRIGARRAPASGGVRRLLRGALIGCASDFGGGHPSRNAAGLPPSRIRSWIGSYRVRRAAGSAASRSNTIRLLITFLLLVLALPASGATVYEGKVVHIADGDTLTIL